MLPKRLRAHRARPTLCWRKAAARWWSRGISSARGGWRKRWGPAFAPRTKPSERQAFQEAAGLLERVLPHVSDPHDRALLLFRMGRLRWLNGEPAPAEQLLADATKHLEDLGLRSRPRTHGST